MASFLVGGRERRNQSHLGELFISELLRTI